MIHLNRAGKSIILFLALFIFGTSGYMIIEGWDVIDSMFMTTITMATVGYSEVNPVSPEGRIFTVVLILSGAGLFLYVAGSAMQFLVEGRLRAVFGRRKLEKIIATINNHYIICGYGRIGKGLCHYLLQKNLAVLIVEKDESRIPEMEADGVPYIIGEANEEDNLEKAGIKRARGLLSVLGSDPDNVFVVLISKQLNPNVYVVARANQEMAKKTLESAGADKVISPYDLGARRMAHAILRPTVIHFLELAFADRDTDINVEEIPVGPDCELLNMTLLDSQIRQKLDVLIIAIKKSDGRMEFNPKSLSRIEAGDTIITVGQAANLIQLEKMLT
ncbi:MAG: potassium channel protein [Deltaproteobacteria bacterium]|nr:potassium channel protein [Deltaproteobacteria bacterium]